MKTAISFMLSLCLLIGCAMPAYAADIQNADTYTAASANAENIVITVHDPINPSILAHNATDNLEVLNGQARGTSLPSQYYDLSIHNYSAQMVKIGNSRLYTNKYFDPDENNEIYVNFTVYSQATGTLRVGIYNMDKGSEAHQDFTFTDATADTIWFSNLTSGNRYAVYFQSVYNGTNTVYMNGTAQVFYPSVMLG